MAQIVTITNPLTGQPAQVDQLEHTAQEIDDAIARALPGGAIDITLQNKAPAGYGLGGIAKILTSSDDLNNIKATGWYCYHRNNQPANVPTPEVYSAVMEVIFGNFSGQTVQRVYSTGDDRDWNLVAQRVFYGSGGWQPWEWVNPPMKLGVEYRTTERYLGKPVYAKAAPVGDIAANTLVIANKFSNGGEAVVRCFAIAKYASGIVTSPQNSLFNCDLVANGLIYTTSNNQVRVLIKADSSMTDCVAVAYYTKA